MRSRIRIYNRRGVPIEEIDATANRSWMLSKTGDCSFMMSKRDEKLMRSVVEYGNLVLVTNPYTKPWVGVLDTPRTWTKQGPRFTAYQADIMLAYQEDQDVDPVTNIVRLPVTLKGTAGAIFRQMIDRANNVEDTLLRVGEVYSEGVDRQETLTTDYLTHARAVAERSLNDFDITPAVQANNTLLLRANWYARKGSEKDITLEEGVNIECQDELAAEQGTIKNSIIGIGAGSTATTRIGAVRQDALSILQYGLRRGSVAYSTVNQMATLGDNALSYVKKSAWPRVTSRVTCVDTGLYKEIDEGDVVAFILHNAGFLDDETLGTRIRARVLGMQAKDDNGTMEILLDEYQGDD